jgi:hypothetical protein
LRADIGKLGGEVKRHRTAAHERSPFGPQLARIAPQFFEVKPCAAVGTHSRAEEIAAAKRNEKVAPPRRDRRDASIDRRDGSTALLRGKRARQGALPRASRSCVPHAELRETVRSGDYGTGRKCIPRQRIADAYLCVEVRERRYGERIRLG